MNYFKEEKEISIKELLFSIASKWRGILRVMLVTIVVTLLINIISAINYIEILGVVVIIKAIFKQIIINSIVAIILMAAIYACVFLFTDTIKSIQEFTMVCNMPILGCIARKEEKYVLKIDKWIKRTKGIRFKISEIELQKEYIAKVLENNITAENVKSKIKVAIVSSYSIDCAELVKDSIIDKVSNVIEIIAVSDINMSPYSIDEIINADYVVFAEYQGKSKYYELEQAIHIMEEWEKKVMGIVLVEVDGI